MTEYCNLIFADLHPVFWKNAVSHIDDILFSHFSDCLECNGLADNSGPICSTCYKKWNQKRKRGRPHSLDQNRVYSSWSWVRNDFSLSNILTSQKGGHQPLANWCVEKFFENHPNLFVASGSTFIPVPPSKSGDIDHAQCLARGFAKATGGSVLNTLTKKSGIKVKTLPQRSKSEALAIESSVKISSLDRVILVDDILTTGTTARECIKALGSPSGIQIWTVAYRLLDG